MSKRSTLLAFLAVSLAIFLAIPLPGSSLRSDEPPWSPRTIRVAILLFDGVQIIDFTGPYEVFGQAGFDVFTVSADGAAITTSMKMRVTPTHGFETVPRADIVVLPGGAVPHRLGEDDPRLAWIRRAAESSSTLLSVCNGAFYLASADLLRGRRATTYALMLDHLGMFGEDVEVVRDERIVDEGAIVTAGGLSAGIDGALHLVERYLGSARAREVANNMEYHWRPDSHWVRSRLADVHAQKILDYAPPAPERISEIYEGDETRWTVKWRIHWPGTPDDMIEQMRSAARGAGWTLIGELEEASSQWTFVDDRQRRWSAHASVEQRAEGELVLDVSVFLD